MIVECAECGTRFNLDESRLRGDSAKVRCSKCRHVFMIQKESSTQPVEPSDVSSDSYTFDTSFSGDSSILSTPADDLFAPVGSDSDFDLFGDEKEPMSPSLSSSGSEPSTPSPTDQSVTDDLFSFADVAPIDDDVPPSSPHRSTEEVAPTVADSFHFSFEEEQKTSPPPEEFDQLDFGISQPATADTEPTPMPAPDESRQVDTPSEPSSVPLAAEAPTSRFGEYRPFIIAGGSTLLLTLLMTAGYFAFKGKPGDYQRLGIQNLKTPGEEEKGSFTIQSPSAFYVKNKNDGDLFVVKASAINRYQTPRIGVEAQVTLFDKEGKPVGSAQGFCNAPIEEEELTTLPYNEILERISQGPSDDPLENTPVEPGKAAACLVVVKNVPPQAVDFGIEIIHSQSEKMEDF